eukprot:6197053-Pleurochrysis_carterae.AAC.1
MRGSRNLAADSFKHVSAETEKQKASMEASQRRRPRSKAPSCGYTQSSAQELSRKAGGAHGKGARRVVRPCLLRDHRQTTLCQRHRAPIGWREGRVAIWCIRDRCLDATLTDCEISGSWNARPLATQVFTKSHATSD